MGCYDIKCDDCKIKIGETDSLKESAEGGRCAVCCDSLKRFKKGV